MCDSERLPSETNKQQVHSSEMRFLQDQWQDIKDCIEKGKGMQVSEKGKLIEGTLGKHNF